MVVLTYSTTAGPAIERLEKEIGADNRNLRIISIVTKAEIETLAILFGWGENKLEQLKSLLGQFLIIPIDSQQIVSAYVDIDSFSQGKHKSKPSDFTSRNMGKNDLWIAATALVTESTLLTSDNDFDHLNDVFIPVKKLTTGKK